MAKSSRFLLMYYVDREFCLWVHETAPAFQKWRSQSTPNNMQQGVQTDATCNI